MTTPDHAELSRLDAEARQLAQVEFDRPLVLEAGAGTGKTATLVARVVAWTVGPGWERHARPDVGSDAIARTVAERVVAITFTEAAAAEMAARVGQALLVVEQGGVPVGMDAGVIPDAAPMRARALLSNLDRLGVRTIHAFCRRLLSQAPFQAGLHPSFDVDADGGRVDAEVRRVIDEHLGAAYGLGADAPALRLAADGFGPDALLEALGVLVESGVDPSCLQADFFPADEIRAATAQLQAGLTRLVALTPPLHSLERSAKALYRAVLAVEGLESEGVADGTFDIAALDKLAERCRDLLDNHGKALGAWANGDPGKRATEKLADNLDAFAREAAVVLGVLRRIGGLRPTRLVAAAQVLHPMLVEVRRRLRAAGVQTFAALLRDAADLLDSHPALTARVRGGMDQLLVDEFQDTDRLQCRIVGALALGGDVRPGLFLVGDPKQSIYGWRNADLRAYDGFVERVRIAGGCSRPLVVNFRSAPPILDEVARLVAPVMVPRPGRQPSFQPLLPSPRNVGASGFAQGPWAPVEHWTCWGRDSDGQPQALNAKDAVEIEAAAVGRDIAALHHDAGVPWSHFGILLRSTTQLEPLLQALREQGVPYLVSRDRSYYQRREILDAAAWVRAVLDPLDTLALVTWLRSPSVGVPDAALLPLWRSELPRLLARLYTPEDLDAALAAADEAVTSFPADVPGIERIAGWPAALRRGLAALFDARQSWERDPSDRFVDVLRGALLSDATEAARFLGAFRLANLDRFFHQLGLSLADPRGGGAQAVLRLLREQVATGAGAEEARPDQEGLAAVAILSIHKAKGLDFTHTYLLQTHRGGRGNQPPAVQVIEGDAGVELVLLGAATWGFATEHQEQNEVESFERVRLLYVALTRARERLVISGGWTPGSTVAPEDAQSLLALMRHRQPPLLEGAALGAALGAAAGAASDPSSSDNADDGLPRGADGDAPRWSPVAGAPDRIEHSGVRQVFAHDLPGPVNQSIETSPAVATAAVDPAADLRLLRRWRAQGAKHQRRPLSGAASAAAHHGLAAMQAAQEARALGEAVDTQADDSYTDVPLGADARDDHNTLASPVGPSNVTSSASPVTSEPTASVVASASHSGRDLAMAIGTAVHRCLEDADLDTAFVDRDAALEQMVSALPSHLRPLLPPDLLPAACLQAESMIRRFGAGPVFDRLIALRGHILGREVPVLVPPEVGTEGPLLVLTGSIDMLYEDPRDGQLVVVDYKTDSVSIADLDARAAAYAPQGAVYQRAIQLALKPPLPPRFELWFLSAGVIRVV
jgi:ATP-dependent helicase/nuclease subunit A